MYKTEICPNTGSFNPCLLKLSTKVLILYMEIKSTYLLGIIQNENRMVSWMSKKLPVCFQAKFIVFYEFMYLPVFKVEGGHSKRGS